MTLKERLKSLTESRASHEQAALATGDMTNQRDLTWRDAILTYGSYATHLGARLGTKQARGVTHFWQERSVRSSTANAQNEGFTYAGLSDASILPAKLDNTCQIFAGRVSATKSNLAEARLGRFGTELVDLVADQTDMEIEGILKDVDRALIRGVEATSDPRAMCGLAGALGTWNGFVQTNQIDGGGDLVTETDFDNCFDATYLAADGRFFPNAIYTTSAVTKVMKGWTDKVRFTIDVSDPQATYHATAGQSIGYYQSQFGLSEVFLHPEIPHNNSTAANNFTLFLDESLIELAFLREMEMAQPGATADQVEQIMVCELTLECKAEIGHALLHNYTKS